MSVSGAGAEELLKTYGLKANDAILAEGKQNEIYEDLAKNFQVAYVAGGAAQNCARAAQYVLPAGSTAYLGAVGKDDLANQLRAANEKEGVISAYQVVEDKPTGACAVIITGHDRSLCTTLGAAESFSPKHLETPEIKKIVEEAKFYYLGGFFLTHGLESAKILAQHAADNKKPFTMNLSAPFIPQFFKSQVDEILPYVDILIGNESEAQAYADSHEWNTKDISEIALKLSASKKISTLPRLVVITQGPESTIVASTETGKATVYPVTPLPASAIVDTNGAGDAFAGAFLGARSIGKSIDEAVEAGHKLGQMCVGCAGPTFSWPKQQIL
ncbi:carbohydrate kinase PfkB [Leucosporidium creatinivorum]|uniref:Adenosine kinase n=1 Tax=Leucosporidium creatinivorum TaxID=106004 RepID=A0A1Y2G3G2_9BASI|nr:carbohydrate kinase PfkB [Leucosporidium creatinivorum]